MQRSIIFFVGWGETRNSALGIKNYRSSQLVDRSKRTNTMRKITAIAVALGFLTSVSLPAFATPAVNGVVKSDDLSAAKKKKKKNDKMEKKSDNSVIGTDLSAAKKKKKKKDSMEKKSENTVLGSDLSAAKKKEKKKDEKKSEILYRIAA